jgi:hypothetical protein
LYRYLIDDFLNSFETKKSPTNRFRLRTMSNSEGIPIRRLVVNDPKDMPLHYGETPGGSIFSTTPGGKILFYIQITENKISII